LGGSEFVERAKNRGDNRKGKMTLKPERKISVIELLEMIGKQEELEQQEEYERLIEENNNNYQYCFSFAISLSFRATI
jgi:archaellum biogenesis protein FlaJ (TadC family)